MGVESLPQIVSPEFWYVTHWWLWLGAGYFVIRYAVFWALKSHTRWKHQQGFR